LVKSHARGGNLLLEFPMKRIENIKSKEKKILIKKCHICGLIMESDREIKKCTKCNKSFLPCHYFNKVHAKTSKEFTNLFSSTQELHEDDLVKGIHVIW
jgi:hypothetical protein